MNREMVSRHVALFEADGEALTRVSNKEKAARYDGTVSEYKADGNKVTKEAIFRFYETEIDKAGKWPKKEDNTLIGMNAAGNISKAVKGYMAFRSYLNNWYSDTLTKRGKSFASERAETVTAERKKKAELEKQEQAKALQKAKEEAVNMTPAIALEFLKSRVSALPTKEATKGLKALVTVASLFDVE